MAVVLLPSGSRPRRRPRPTTRRTNRFTEFVVYAKHTEKGIIEHILYKSSGIGNRISNPDNIFRHVIQ